ncbi:hypothetical protein [Draconibacterium mangrovi]|uniref:hypothetical protein n=1 Tax=Draconibacterium mangrovi TaxID=2697469 RepID=UPI0013D31949|nr:hypothetical protein [Draconibacterium mangrovi]
MQRDTSIKAYNSIKANGLITGRRMEVYTCLYQFGPLTASQVFLKTGLKTNQSGRFTELKEMGAIREKGRITCPVTKSEAILWDVADTIPVEPKKKSTRKDKKKEVLKLIAEIGKKVQDPEKSQLRNIWHKVNAL